MLFHDRPHDRTNTQNCRSPEQPPHDLADQSRAVYDVVDRHRSFHARGEPRCIVIPEVLSHALTILVPPEGMLKVPWMPDVPWLYPEKSTRTGPGTNPAS